MTIVDGIELFHQLIRIAQILKNGDGESFYANVHRPKPC